MPSWRLLTTILGAFLVFSHGAISFSAPCPGSQAVVEDEGSYEKPLRLSSNGVVEANQYVRQVFLGEKRSRYRDAMNVYLRLVALARDSLSAKEQGIVNCHRRQLDLILPESLGQSIQQPNKSSGPPLGQRLRTWWRAQDPYPSTAANERVRQHLQRIANATRQYADGASKTGVDRRGEVYIRLGPPRRTTRVRFKSPRILSIIRNSTSLTRGDFPRNEYWVYPHIGENVKYVFVKTGGTWEVGGAPDLVPSVVKSRMGVDGSGSQVRKLGAIFEEVYSQLATIDISYSGLYQQAESVTAMTVSGGREGVSRMRQFLAESRGYEQRLVADRRRTVRNGWPTPTLQPNSSGVKIRTSRFLTQKGKTRTVLDWGLSSSGLQREGATGEPFLMDTFGVRYDSRYRRVDSVARRYRIGREEGLSEAESLAESMMLGATDEGLYHASVQWNLYGEKAGKNGSEGVRRRLTARVDSLRVLNPDSSRLEMSDLRLLTVPGDTVDLVGISQDQNASPYPFSTVSPKTPLLLYFEAYHLQRNEEGDTNYRVTYEVEKTDDDGFFERLFGGGDEVTSTTSTYTGTKPRTEEYIRVDGIEHGSGRQPIEITVRISDVVSGQQVEQDIALDLIRSPRKRVQPPEVVRPGQRR